MSSQKALVHDFWDAASCGEELYLDSSDRAGFEAQAKARYDLEPYIKQFADFPRWKGKKVLEIGVGLGADHQQFAEAGADLSGIDLTGRAIAHTADRLAKFGLTSKLSVGDAEALAFPNETFDLVYSWGVIHHSPDTRAAAREILRVLRPGGDFRVMIYNKHSIIGFMLWLRYGLAVGKPFRSWDDIYANHLESPGTKAYTIREATELFAGAADVRIETVLTHGDLLEGQAGQRHSGLALTVARMLWPRPLVRAVFPKAGLFMLISGRKPT